jgi:hypothetical protein
MIVRGGAEGSDEPAQACDPSRSGEGRGERRGLEPAGARPRWAGASRPLEQHARPEGPRRP